MQAVLVETPNLPQTFRRPRWTGDHLRPDQSGDCDGSGQIQVNKNVFIKTSSFQMRLVSDVDQGLFMSCRGEQASDSQARQRAPRAPGGERLHPAPMRAPPMTHLGTDQPPAGACPASLAKAVGDGPSSAKLAPFKDSRSHKPRCELLLSSPCRSSFCSPIFSTAERPFLE